MDIGVILGILVLVILLGNNMQKAMDNPFSFEAIFFVTLLVMFLLYMVG
jgi:hypothetical protein